MGLRRVTLLLGGLGLCGCLGPPAGEAATAAMGRCGPELAGFPDAASWQAGRLTLLGHDGSIAVAEAADPLHLGPIQVLRIGLPIPPWATASMAVDSTLAVVGNLEAGLQVVDLSGAAPVLSTTFQSVLARSVALRGRTAYVATGTEIVVLGLSDLAQVDVVARVPAIGGRLALGGRTLVLLSLETRTIQVFELEASTGRPVPKGKAQLPAGADPSSAPPLVAGNRILVGTSRGVVVVDLDRNLRPGRPGLLALPDLRRLAVGDGVLFATTAGTTDKPDTLLAIELAARYRVLASEPIPGLTSALVASGRSAMVVYGDASLERTTIRATSVDRMLGLAAVAEAEPNDGGPTANHVPAEGGRRTGTLSPGDVDTFWTSTSMLACRPRDGIDLDYLGDTVTGPICEDRTLPITIDVKADVPLLLERLDDDCTTAVAVPEIPAEDGQQRFVLEIGAPRALRIRAVDAGAWGAYELRLSTGPRP